MTEDDRYAAMIYAMMIIGLLAAAGVSAVLASL